MTDNLRYIIITYVAEKLPSYLVHGQCTNIGGHMIQLLKHFRNWQLLSFAYTDTFQLFYHFKIAMSYLISEALQLFFVFEMLNTKSLTDIMLYDFIFLVIVYVRCFGQIPSWVSELTF